MLGEWLLPVRVEDIIDNSTIVLYLVHLQIKESVELCVTEPFGACWVVVDLENQLEYLVPAVPITFLYG